MVAQRAGGIIDESDEVVPAAHSSQVALVSWFELISADVPDFDIVKVAMHRIRSPPLLAGDLRRTNFAFVKGETCLESAIKVRNAIMKPKGKAGKDKDKDKDAGGGAWYDLPFGLSDVFEAAEKVPEPIVTTASDSSSDDEGG